MTPRVARVILYVRDMPKVAAFYERHFGFKALASPRKDWLELSSGAGDCTIALHQAAVTQKSGAAMKLVFAVRDVREFVEQRKAEGLKFGVVHQVDGFAFSNAKDPAGNSIQVSSRGVA
ncbi:MAG TPA: VOC family protein [Opitutus sp.]|nr:VOC family protein [Opitutus sp.]